MTVFIRTDNAVVPCDGYFYIQRTNVVPNKWGIFASQLGLPSPTLLCEYQDDTVYSGHDKAQLTLDFIVKNLADGKTIDIR